MNDKVYTCIGARNFAKQIDKVTFLTLRVMGLYPFLGLSGKRVIKVSLK